jgi:cellobiose transport system substrate-binding protein
VLLSISACGWGEGETDSSGGDGSSPPADSGGEETSFEFWSFTGIGQKEGVNDYMAEHPEVDIELTEVGTSQETAQALTTALAGGKVPDLVLIQGDEMPKFLEESQNFVDLRSMGAEDLTGDYLDWVIAQSTGEDGTVIGIPTDVGGMAMAYRVDLFEEAGLPTDPDEVADLWPTWGDYLDVAKEYTAGTGTPFMDNASTTIFYQAVNQVSEKYFDNDTHEPIYDSNPQVREAFDLSIEAATSGTTARLTSFTEGWSAGMADGAFATIATPSWMLGIVEGNAPETEGLWGLTPVPGQTGNWGGSYLAIPARADNPEAAWAYITETQSPDGQLARFLDGGGLPTTPSVYDDPDLLAVTDPFFSDALRGEIFTQSVLELEPFYIGPDSGTIGAEFQNAIIEVENNGADPDAAWDTAIDNIATAIGQ